MRSWRRAGRLASARMPAHPASEKARLSAGPGPLRANALAVRATMPMFCFWKWENCQQK